MTTLGPYTVHPFAELFPLIEGDAFDELVRDIKSQGQREPIVLTADQSTIIDGRNRYRACMAAGSDPVFTTLHHRYDDEMILDFILSGNLHRRHMNPGQLAMLAVDLIPVFQGIAKKAQKAGNARGGEATPGGKSVADRPPTSSPPADERKARAMAAKAVGAAARTVGRAAAVERDTPDLADAVKRGDLALNAADKQRRLRERSAPRAERLRLTPSRVKLTLLTHEGVAVPYPKPQASATFNESKGEGISWAAWSWNPVTGCLHGCPYCYAREMATSASYRATYPAGFTPLFHHERLDAPANTRIPKAHEHDPAYRRVFVCSMADLYGKWVPDEWLDQIHAAMGRNLQWEYLLLTKFPTRYAKVALPPGAWVGTSVDTQRRVNIAQEAMAAVTGVKVRWLSLEPLLEPLRFTDLSMFDWVVIGAQTETRQPDGVVPAFAPPIEWVTDLIAQARDSGCRVHLKPNLLGETSPQLPGMALPDEYPES
jgi:protein gp37